MVDFPIERELPTEKAKPEEILLNFKDGYYRIRESNGTMTPACYFGNLSNDTAKLALDLFVKCSIHNGYPDVTFVEIKDYLTARFLELFPPSEPEE